ncbi:MAG: HAD-IC family P-type ATPase [Methanotrichaceae archaeon]|nr:HAD-IC family P-type ATPase [Methanotrichaceae archaeon]
MGEIIGAEHVQINLYQMLVAVGLCNNAKLDERSGQWIALGDSTEAALLTLAAKAGIDLHAEALRFPRLHEFPFDTQRKRMTTVHRDQTGQVAYVKGAPKEMPELCKRIMMNSSEIPIDDSMRRWILNANGEYAHDGLRVLAIAAKRLPIGIEKTSGAVEKDLTFLGLIAMIDPPRIEVKDAVEKCHAAGIKIIMITGDYWLTAESVARHIGIAKSHPKVITGQELDSIDDDVLEEALKSELVLARATPEHKLRMVSVLQRLGHVVAVTGDGVNDAPALKKADIGMALGSGTDVAKEASDMILTDDDFASIVNAVEEVKQYIAASRDLLPIFSPAMLQKPYLSSFLL